jgi:hypothetical protein
LKKSLFILFILAISKFAFVQSLDNLNKKDLIKISGGLNFNNTLFLTDRANNTRDPFAWHASGNINISALGMSFPFTYAISNQGRNYSQPANLSSINPSYKWFKSYIGRSSMSFSPYTLSGVNYSGVGVELTPKNFTLQAMYGMINKAIDYNAEEKNTHTISYRRWACGLSFAYKIKNTDFKVIFLKAFDDANSLIFIPGESTIKPKDNIVASFQVKTKFWKKFDFESEVASSLITNNLRNQENFSEKRWFSFMYPLVQGNGTTSMYNAYKAGVNYNLKALKIGFNYERVDPDYQTLGGLFFTNDIENFTLTPSFTLFKKKVNVAINTGLQRNDISKDKAAQTDRYVASVNLSAQLMKGLSSSFSYSNFSTFTRNNPLIDPFTNQITYLDTFNVYQISENIATNLSYSFGTKNKKSVSTSFNYQTSQNITGDLENARAFGINANGTSKPAKTYVATGSYSYNLAAKKITLGCNANANYSILESNTNLFIGPSFTLGKNFGKNKPSLSTGVTYNRNYQKGILTNNVFNYRLTASYAPKLIDEKKGIFNFSLSAMMLHKLPTLDEIKKLHELTIMANIAYNFK